MTDPKTIEYLMQSIKPDRPVPKIPLTQPPRTHRNWVGARNYLQACSAVYGETPRPDDPVAPKPSMMVAMQILEPILAAHPLVLEPEQMNAIDHEDWSFAESIDYAQMAHLPFEPLYLDFGGHTPVWVELEAGPCQLHGAVIWRSGFYRVPTLAVAPIGGFQYLTGPLADKLIEEGLDESKVVDYVGSRPGKEVVEGEMSTRLSPSDRQRYGSYQSLDRRVFEQWSHQPAGICWFGVSTPDVEPYVTMGRSIRMQSADVKVPLVFSTGHAIAQALGEERLLADPKATKAQLLSGMWDNTDADFDQQWARMARAATEMVAKLAERALLGLYFIENAPVKVQEVPLSRPERREMTRKAQKGRDPGEIASIVVIRSSRSQGTSAGGGREYSHRFERRGHFRHIHSNNRHYQLRPDLVKPCHKCYYEHHENIRALRENREPPYPNTESEDCIKRWIDAVVVGPEDKPLKKK